MARKTKVNYRRIWENHHQACVLKGMHIHHIDGDPHNNDPENLMICTPEEHWDIHYRQGDIVALSGKFIQGAAEAGRKGGKAGVGWKFSKEGSERLSQSLIESYIRRGGSPLKGTSISEETKAKISEGVRGEKNGMFNKKHSKEAKAKMSKNRKGIVGREAGWNHTEEDKAKISKKRKEYYKNGGLNPKAKRWDIFDENDNLLFTSMLKCDIMNQYNLNERSYKTLLTYMRRNDFKKPHCTLKILIKEATNND